MMFFTRVGFRLQDPVKPERLSHLGVDTADINPIVSGNVFEHVNWSASLYAIAQTQLGNVLPSGGNVTLLDLIAQFDFHDAFHIWAGRMTIPSDRSNFSGPYFMNAWNYPGLYSLGGPPVVVAPKGEYLGRGVGGTLWGQLGGGLFKYYAGAYQLDRPGAPLFSGRLNLALINPEPGYEHGSSYYGDKDILAIGVGAQAQKDGSNQLQVDPTTGVLTPGAAKDFAELNADVLAEFNVGGGTFTAEAAVYKFDGYASAAPVDLAFFVLGSYILPFDVAGGRLQPLIRYQATVDPDMTMIDAFLNYILKGPLLRIHAGYQRTSMGKDPAGNELVGNAVQLGAQLLQL